MQGKRSKQREQKRFAPFATACLNSSLSLSRREGNELSVGGGRPVLVGKRNGKSTNAPNLVLEKSIDS